MGNSLEIIRKCLDFVGKLSLDLFYKRKKWFSGNDVKFSLCYYIVISLDGNDTWYPSLTLIFSKAWDSVVMQYSHIGERSLHPQKLFACVTMPYYDCTDFEYLCSENKKEMKSSYERISNCVDQYRIFDKIAGIFRRLSIFEHTAHIRLILNSQLQISRLWQQNLHQQNGFFYF